MLEKDQDKRIDSKRLNDEINKLLSHNQSVLSEI